MKTGKERAYSRHTLMKKIQVYAFNLLETALYLDTHPDDQQAMAYYGKVKKAYDEHVAAYEAEYGPLSMGGNVGKGWQWVDGPWPWETEAN